MKAEILQENWDKLIDIVETTFEGERKDKLTTLNKKRNEAHKELNKVKKSAKRKLEKFEKEIVEKEINDLKQKAPEKINIIAMQTSIDLLKVVTSKDMHKQVIKHFSDVDIVIMAAAVSDFKPVKKLTLKPAAIESQELLIKFEFDICFKTTSIT